jgi:lysine 6-dehydrogenase
MKVLIIGAGLMGRAIAYDLSNFSNFDEVAVVDKDRNSLKSAETFLKNKDINYGILDVKNSKDVKNYFQKFDVAISAIPYFFNYDLTKIAIQSKTHFLDLGGNNEIVEKQRSLFEEAKKNKVIILPDCGLSPGMTSILVKDIVDYLDSVEYVNIRVGGLPITPVPPFNYQLVFSPNGLINEYVEDALVLDKGKIIAKKSMTELETIEFPYPFGKLEAFLTSGGVSTLPFTFKDRIGYLDDKTIRYPGHCQMFKPLLDLGLASEKPIKINDKKIVPREVFTDLLMKTIPRNGKDVVLIKIFAKGIKNGKNIDLEYGVIDYYDEKYNLTSMMRTTGFPVSIVAQLIERGLIKDYGVFGNEEIVPTPEFFKELNKRNIKINKKIG